MEFRFFTGFKWYLQVQLGILFRHIILYRNLNVVIALSRLVSSFLSLEMLMSGRSLCSDESETDQGLIIFPAATICPHPYSILACSVVGFSCSDLTSTTTGALSPGLSVAASEYRPMNAVSFTVMYTVQMTTVSRAT